MTQFIATHPGHADRGGHTGTAICLALSLALLLAVGCSRPEDDFGVLAEVAAGGDHQDWDAVRPKIRAYLLKHPDDILGHYYFGLSYLHRPAPQLTFAEGEFLTAQTLLAQAKTFPEEILGVDRNEFSGELHRKTALTYMRGYREILRSGLPHSYGEVLLKKANAQVELGLQASPSSAGLREYAEYLRQVLGLDATGPKIITERVGDGVSI